MIPLTFTAYQALAKRGAMTTCELARAMGCTHRQASRAAQRLADEKQARRTNRPGHHGYVYEVAR